MASSLLPFVAALLVGCYERWFLRRLPQSGVRLDLPMSQQPETLIRTMVVRTE